MPDKKYLFPIITLAICAFIAGYSLHQVQRYQTQQPIITIAPSGQPPSNNTKLIGSHRPNFALPDLQDQEHTLQDWQGKTLLINFWATWCAPCREEIPALIATQKKYQDHNLQIIGIAIDDTIEIQKFLNTNPINYPILHGQQTAMDIGKTYGNLAGALPYTVFIDASGTIRHIHDQGKLDETTLGQILETLNLNIKLP